MIPFLASKIHDIAVNLSYLHTMVIRRQEKEGISIPIKREEIVRLKKQVDQLHPLCKPLGMKRTLERFYKIEHLEVQSLKVYPLHFLAAEIDELISAVLFDLTEKKFLYIPPDEASHYEQDDLFGVADKFPEANKELKFAGNCYATGSYTACVFHLMRAVEVGARVMVKAMKAEKHITIWATVKGVKKKVKKPIQLCTWKELSSGLKSALNELESGKGYNLKKQEIHTFFSEAVGSFDTIKDAWRNIISHGNDVADGRKLYLKGEATDIMNNTRHFITHLAKKLKE